MKTRHLLPALLFLASAIPSRAALIYSGVQNVAIPQTLDGVYVRLSDGFVTGTYPGDPGWAAGAWLNPFFGGVDVGNNPLLRPIITGTDQIVNLSLGTVIDSGSNFVAGESGSSTHTGAAANQFHPGTPGLIGFAFETTVGGPDHYGWLRMTVNNAGVGNITDWAIDDTAGVAVLAGVSSVPEPATVLVGVALCGVSVLRRRRRL